MHPASKSRDSNGDLPLKLSRLICIICQGTQTMVETYAQKTAINLSSGEGNFLV